MMTKLLKVVLVLTFYLAASAGTTPSEGFLPILHPQESAEEQVIPSSESSSPLEESHESFLSESQIEDGESGCFKRYAYGKNVKGFELSVASVSCPNPNVYRPVEGGCNVMGNGLEHATYSYQNFYYCSSQGIKVNDYHRVAAYVQCCSV